MTDNTMICAGIDVAKDRLDIALYPGELTFSVSNDRHGFAALDRLLGEHDVLRIGFEASGGYELKLMMHLRKGCRPAVRVQPAQVRAFARSRLLRAKNDRLDARLIARFVSGLEAVRPLADACFDRLSAELTYLEQIEQQIALLKTFAETAFDSRIRRRHEQALQRLETRRKAHLLLIETELRRNEALGKRLDLVQSIKGVGLRTALSLVIRLPELGQASREEVAALTGLAPYDDDSGTRRGKRRVVGGRDRLRKALFMCAFAATRHNPDLAGFYKRLRANGKDHLLAVIATARKLIVLANAIILRGTPWQPQAAQV